MRRLALLAVLINALPSLSSAQAPQKGAAGATTAAQDVRRTDARLRTALITRDSIELARIYADDYTHVGSDGVVTSKAERLAEFRSGIRRFESIERSEYQVRVFRDVAIVTCRELVQGTVQGQRFVARLLSTRVYVQRARRWQLFRAHSTAISGG